MTEAVKKSEQTRRRILEAALRLFQKRGFSEATMRDIAKEANVALGAAYYYFASKDAIVMSFYERAQEEWIPEAEKALSGSEDAKERLGAVIDAKLKCFAPHRRLLGSLSAHIDPQHPLSPFSDQTRHIRERDIGFMTRALEGTKLKVASDLRPYMARLLWLYQLGLILFWIYDRSPQQRRTRELFEKSLGIVVGLIKLSAFPLLRPVRKLAIGLLAIVYEEEPVAAKASP
jgi:AcrR family transcriptional regulator